MLRVTVSTLGLVVLGLVAIIGSAGGGIGGMILLGYLVHRWRCAHDRERTGL